MNILIMCALYIPWICCYNFLQCVFLIEWNVWEDKWAFAIKTLQERKKKAKNVIKKSDLICGQYTNTCKLRANFNGQDFKNHKL
jgi:hypothetical protein